MIALARAALEPRSGWIRDRLLRSIPRRPFNCGRSSVERAGRRLLRPSLNGIRSYVIVRAELW